MSAKPNAEVSITDVAALANVSTATVSRVLSGRRQKDDDIARRVRKAAKQLHYAVNLAASSLRSEVTNTLGFVCPDPHHPMAASLLEAFVAACDKLDRHVFVNFGNTSEEQARLVNAMAARRVDGLAVVPPYGADMAKILDDAGTLLPIVQITGSSTSYQTNWVGIDERASMSIVLAHLQARNAHAIAYLGGSLDSREAADLYAEFQSQLITLNLTCEPNWPTFGPLTVQRGYADVLTLLSAGASRPDAIICSSKAVAIGALLALDHLGLRVPDDMLVLGMDSDGIDIGDRPANPDNEDDQEEQPILTTLRPPYERIADQALHLLSSRISGKQRMAARIAYPPLLVAGTSTAVPTIGDSNMAEPLQ